MNSNNTTTVAVAVVAIVIILALAVSILFINLRTKVAISKMKDQLNDLTSLSVSANNTTPTGVQVCEGEPTKKGPNPSYECIQQEAVTDPKPYQSLSH